MRLKINGTRSPKSKPPMKFISGYAPAYFTRRLCGPVGPSRSIVHGYNGMVFTHGASNSGLDNSISFNLFTQQSVTCDLWPVWYENLSGVVIRPDKSRHKHRWY